MHHQLYEAVCDLRKCMRQVGFGKCIYIIDVEIRDICDDA